jgi:hypothetical protein
MINDTMTQCTSSIGCPSCNKKLRVPEGLKTNAKVSCRSCGNVFRMGIAKSSAQQPLVPAQFTSEAAQATGGSCSSAKPARRRSGRNAALLLLTSCLLAAVVGGIVDLSTEAQPPVAGATPAATVERLQDKRAPANEVKPSGFQELLSMGELSNWRGIFRDPSDEVEVVQIDADELMRKHWKLKDGVLSYDGPPKGVSICTKADYGDFELYVDWKTEADGDSGIYLRGFPQVQIWDSQSSRLQTHGANRGSGGLWNNKQNGKVPLVNADKPAGSWNRFYIKMVGDRVTVKLNDKLVSDNVVLENLWNRQQPVASSGPIELQSFTGKMSFRNIYLRALEPTGYAGGDVPPKKANLEESTVAPRSYSRPSARSNYAAQMDAARRSFEGQPRGNGYSQGSRSAPGWDEDAQYEQHLARRRQSEGWQRMNRAVPGLQPVPRRALGLDR